VVAARDFLDSNRESRITLRELGRAVGMSPFHLQREFKKQFGVSPSEYVRAHRTARFRTLLREEATVSRASYAAGYGSSSRVYEGAAQHLGMTPAAYRRGGRGLDIRYAVVASPLGELLVAVTHRGVCAVKLGNSAAELERALHAEFSRATITRVNAGDEWLEAMVERVATHLPVNGVNADHEIPLDVAGTAFQWRVWRALQRIPVGETRSYSAVARAIGKPKAVRAVAQACAANRVAVVVPCHRVVRDDGTLGGYRWGVEVKARLLGAEADSPTAANS
jgi:AraC family transcriptional regulator, regulatory protein of adaptative response / methylated-DNA-[protein]-cysteine methyltransferase